MLKRWNRRQLTPLGKITVVKTLAVSKIILLFTNLPDPPAVFLQERTKICFQFLWNGKQNKIKKSVVCKPYEDGGLRMIDVYSFLCSMKLTWLRRITAESHCREFVLNMYPELGLLYKKGGEYANVIMQRINNPFWRDVLKHFKKFCSKCLPDTDSDNFSFGA